jgi:hypothetical protein
MESEDWAFVELVVGAGNLAGAIRRDKLVRMAFMQSLCASRAAQARGEGRRIWGRFGICKSHGAVMDFRERIAMPYPCRVLYM